MMLDVGRMSTRSAASQAEDAEQARLQTVAANPSQLKRSSLRRSGGENDASSISAGVRFSGGSGEAGGRGSREQPNEQESLRSAISKWDSKLANSRTFWDAARRTGQ